MAIWQYVFTMIPTEDLNLLGIEDRLPREVYDDFTFWNSYYDLTFFEPFRELLEPNKSWSEAITLYGNTDSNCIEIYSDEGKISSVSFRIDYTIDYSVLLNKLIEFCTLNAISILDENLYMLQLNFTTILSVIENSPQVEKYKTLSGINQTNKLPL